jgi:hypothetical protein
LASNRASSVAPDLTDVTEAVAAFQQHNHCRVVITVRQLLPPAVTGLWLEGKALSERDVDGMRVLLCSSSVTCAELNTLTMDSAILALLYRLDYALADEEFRATLKKDA